MLAEHEQRGGRAGDRGDRGGGADEPGCPADDAAIGGGGGDRHRGGDQVALRGHRQIVARARADRRDRTLGRRIDPARQHRHREPLAPQPREEGRDIGIDVDHHQRAIARAQRGQTAVGRVRHRHVGTRLARHRRGDPHLGAGRADH